MGRLRIPKNPLLGAPSGRDDRRAWGCPGICQAFITSLLWACPVTVAREVRESAGYKQASRAPLDGDRASHFPGGIAPICSLGVARLKQPTTMVGARPLAVNRYDSVTLSRSEFSVEILKAIALQEY